MSKFKDLQLLLSEANELSGKAQMSKTEERRYSYLLAAISAVKSGASLSQIDEQRHNETAKRNGFPKLKKTKKSERRAADFREFVLKGPDSSHLMRSEAEYRDGAVHPTQKAPEPVAIGSYAGLGYFVPVEFVKSVTKAALKLGDEILDPTVSTPLSSTNGRALVLPTFNDTGEAFVPVGEGALDTSNDDDVNYPGEVSLGAISFRSTYKVSIDSLQDVEASGSLYNVWWRWTAQRIARGVGKLAIAGTNSDPIKGLITQLENTGLTPLIATGAAVNDGTGATGANSVGSQDLANLYFNVDPMYRHSPNCVWMMADTVLLKLCQLVDKSGRPIVLWEEDGLATIFGKRVAVCNSMPSPSPSQVTVVFGDASYFYIRRVNDGLAGVRVLRERYIDSGQIGLQTISRWDCKLALTAIAGKSPFAILQQHS